MFPSAASENSPIDLFIKIRDDARRDDLAHRDVGRNTFINGERIGQAPRHRLEVSNLYVDRGGVTGEEARNHAILSE